MSQDDFRFSALRVLTILSRKLWTVVREVSTQIFEERKEVTIILKNANVMHQSIHGGNL